MAATMIGYMAENMTKVTDGQEVLATVTYKRVYKDKRSWLSSERVYFDAVGTDGTKYYGRGFGDGVHCYLYTRKEA